MQAPPEDNNPINRAYEAWAARTPVVCRCLCVGLAACDGFVGKFTSNIDRLAVALSNAWRGGDCVTPFESLDAAWCADYGRRTGKSIHGDFMC